MALALLMPAMLACDPLPVDRAPIGLSRDEASGRVAVHFFTCPNESVLRLRVLYSEDLTVGNGDDLVLWEIRADNGASHLTEFQVGVEPPGFNETVPLTAALPENRDLIAEVETTELREILQDFPINALPSAGIDVNGDIMSESELERRALSRCGT